VKFRQILIILISAMGITSCVTTPAEREAGRIQTLANDNFKQSKECRVAIQEKLEYANLYQKFGVTILSLPTSAQLEDDTKVTDEAIALGFDWYAEIENCDRADIERLGRIDPELGMIATNMSQRETEIVAMIVKSHPTYGEINKKILQIKNNYRAALAQWNQKLKVRLQQEQQQELEVRQEYLAEIGTVTEAVGNVALAGVAVLAHNQKLLAQLQLNYAAANPSYVPANLITVTNCRVTHRMWACVQAGVSP
jgi:hypothetical protein